MILGILASMNLLGAANEPNTFTTADAQCRLLGMENAQAEKKCEGTLVIEGLCDPLCEKIFSYTKTDEEEVKEALHLFREVMDCEHVCTCVCESVCDEFM